MRNFEGFLYLNTDSINIAHHILIFYCWSCLFGALTVSLSLKGRLCSTGTVSLHIQRYLVLSPCMRDKLTLDRLLSLPPLQFPCYADHQVGSLKSHIPLIKDELFTGLNGWGYNMLFTWLMWTVEFLLWTDTYIIPLWFVLKKKKVCLWDVNEIFGHCITQILICLFSLLCSCDW